MKIKLSIAEAHILVLRALNMPADTEVVISRQPNPSAEIRLCLNEIEQMDYVCGDKIRAIKRLRETCPCGLAEAKWAVENWSQFKTFVTKRRRWPKFGGQYNYFTLE